MASLEKCDNGNVKPKLVAKTDFPSFIEQLRTAVINTNEYAERIRQEAYKTYGSTDGLYGHPDSDIWNTIDEVVKEGDAGSLGLAVVLVQFLEGYNAKLQSIANGMRERTGYFNEVETCDSTSGYEADEPKKSFRKGR